ncbi:hypothetical protein ACFL2V_13575 [Pseudomonadota bacterium]
MSDTSSQAVAPAPKQGKRNTLNLQSSLREQLYREAHAMAEYALTNGLNISATALSTLERYKVDLTNDGYIDSVRTDLPIDPLIKAHEALTKAIEPAKPRTILLLNHEKKHKGIFSFLGPVALIRQLMVAALISLGLFIGLALFPEVDSKGGNILASNGWHLLLNLLFYISAAGLGASFAALYKANSYITNGTFDPTYQASYWIRFFLGLIAGLILSVLISEEAFKAANAEGKFLEDGIVRPLLAILGGFSADLAYTVLSRLVETFESLFRGSTKTIINNQIGEEKNRLDEDQRQKEMKMVGDLVNLQQQINTGDPRQASAAISSLLGNMMPLSNISAPPEEVKEEIKEEVKNEKPENAAPPANNT